MAPNDITYCSIVDSSTVFTGYPDVVGKLILKYQKGRHSAFRVHYSISVSIQVAHRYTVQAPPRDQLVLIDTWRKKGRGEQAAGAIIMSFRFNGRRRKDVVISPNRHRKQKSNYLRNWTGEPSSN